MLPNFLIIGAPRSGTTFLERCLKQHPEVFMPDYGYTGDIHFFCVETQISSENNWAKGFAWYNTLFDPGTGKKRIGEKTAYYLMDKSAPILIKKHLPHVKMLAVLRNPIDRIHSDYWYHRGEIPLKTSILNAITDPKLARLQLLDAGCYAEQIERYWALFPKTQLHFVAHDDIQAKPAETLRQIFAYLDIAPDFVPDSLHTRVNQAQANSASAKTIKRLGGAIKQNAPQLFRRLRQLPAVKHIQEWIGKNSEGQTANNYPPLTSTEWHFFANYYKESIHKLSNMLNRDFATMWLKTTNT